MVKAIRTYEREEYLKKTPIIMVTSRDFDQRFLEEIKKLDITLYKKSYQKKFLEKEIEEVITLENKPLQNKLSKR